MDPASHVTCTFTPWSNSMRPLWPRDDPPSAHRCQPPCCLVLFSQSGTSPGAMKTVRLEGLKASFALVIAPACWKTLVAHVLKVSWAPTANRALLGGAGMPCNLVGPFLGRNTPSLGVLRALGAHTESKGASRRAKNHSKRSNLARVMAVSALL